MDRRKIKKQIRQLLRHRQQRDAARRQEQRAKTAAADVEKQVAVLELELARALNSEQVVLDGKLFFRNVVDGSLVERTVKVL